MVICVYINSYLKQFVLPALVNLREIEKIYIRRKLAKEEIDAKLLSMTPEARLRKGPALSDVEVSTWSWQIKQPQIVSKPKINDSRTLEEVLGKNQDWSHLNKRRQGARLENIEKDIKWAKQLVDVRMQARVEKVRESQKVQAIQSSQIK